MSAQSCLAVMYHYVRDTADTRFPEIRALAPDAFAQQLDWLQQHYAVIDLARFDAAVNDGAPLPANAAILTFDDGFADHYDTVFPMLRDRGLTGVFFLARASCSSNPWLLPVHRTHLLLATMGAEAFGRAVLAECGPGPLPGAADVGPTPRVFGVDSWEERDDKAIKHLINYQLPFDQAEDMLESLCRRHLGDTQALARALYLDEPQVREMARGGMAFGYHTRTHRMLSRMTAEDQREELAGGVSWISSLTGQSRVSFCYPWGGPQTYTGETLRLLADAGYSLAFNTVRRRARPGVDDRFELPRLDARDLPPHTDGEAGDALAVGGQAGEAGEAGEAGALRG
jgi:peptidoglycan/xylan/chitin deacetylase (PgdA/CDA1 family)